MIHPGFGLRSFRNPRRNPMKATSLVLRSLAYRVSGPRRVKRPGGIPVSIHDRVTAAGLAGHLVPAPHLRLPSHSLPELEHARARQRYRCRRILL